MIVVAIEGVGGSGKSAVLERLRENLRAQQLDVAVCKVGGLGETSRERTLKKIMDSRERILQEGEFTEKQYRDKERDRVFRLAIRYQAKQFRRLIKNISPELVLLDRTSSN